MSSSRTPWSSSDDYLLFSTLAIIFGLTLLSYAVWTIWHADIARFYIECLIWQIQHLHTHNPALLGLERDLYAASYRPDLVRPIQLWYGLMILGTGIRIPSVTLIALLGVVCIVRAAPGQFTKALDLEGLIEVQARMFPTLRAFAKRRLDVLSLIHI